MRKFLVVGASAMLLAFIVADEASAQRGRGGAGVGAFRAGPGMVGRSAMVGRAALVGRPGHAGENNACGAFPVGALETL
jgi:hypothetical protein